MDLHKLTRLINTAGQNGTATQLNLAPTILEAFVPGYSIFSKVISQTFGFDAGVVVSAGLLLFALATAWRYISRNVWHLFTEYGSSYVYIQEDDMLFRSVLDWIALQRVGRTATRLKAVSNEGYIDDEDFDEMPGADEVLAADELFQYKKIAGKIPPMYEPHYGTYVFFYKFHLFIFERQRRERQGAVMWRNASTDEQNIQIRTWGWSTKPLKMLLTDIKQWRIERVTDVTAIYRPQSKDTRRREGAWTRVTSRPSRPMDTVILDQNQKQALIKDVNEYLSPATPIWYAQRGIPLRRGYLFHGPPGTGKSSLSFALAGLFGLDIYVISLLDPTLTETDLHQLFANLPRRSIVLLEDIDTAGLENREQTKQEESKSPDSSEYEKITAADLAKELTKANRRGGGRRGNNSDGDGSNSNGISLSGLLNAIDGVASHEGRVLIMTSNHPEKLDPALIRPGRVDMQVAFTLATCHQIKEIFVKMYASEDEENKKPTGPTIASKSDKHGIVHAKGAEPPKKKKHFTGIPGLERDELEPLAEQFAERVPADSFSPAEIQNFLITRKKDPYKAVDEASAWRDELLESKAVKAKK